MMNSHMYGFLESGAHEALSLAAFPAAMFILGLTVVLQLLVRKRSAHNLSIASLHTGYKIAMLAVILTLQLMATILTIGAASVHVLVTLPVLSAIYTVAILRLVWNEGLDLRASQIGLLALQVGYIVFITIGIAQLLIADYIAA